MHLIFNLFLFSWFFNVFCSLRRTIYPSHSYIMMASGLLIWYYNKDQLNFISSLSFLNEFHLMSPNLVSKICKDKVEAEVWFAGLNVLISPGQHGSQHQHIDGIRNGALSFEVNSLQHRPLCEYIIVWVMISHHHYSFFFKKKEKSLGRTLSVFLATSVQSFCLYTVFNSWVIIHHLCSSS